jgi:hypothetical protein
MSNEQEIARVLTTLREPRTIRVRSQAILEHRPRENDLYSFICHRSYSG